MTDSPKCLTCKYLRTVNIHDGIYADVCFGMYGREGEDVYDPAKKWTIRWQSPFYRKIVTPKVDVCQHHEPRTASEPSHTQPEPHHRLRLVPSPEPPSER